MSEASLGKHWPTLNKAQRDLFMSLFQELVFHSYMKKIRSANKEAKIEYEDETKRAQGGAEVEAIAITKKMEVELRFILRAGAKQKGEALYVAEDVVIDEVSLVNNYREEFNKIIAAEGFDGLIAKMKKQVQKVK
jgi:phospholipid transport system substrate-binding protein